MFIHSFEIFIISFHSVFFNCITDRRDCFIRAILESFGLFFICSNISKNKINYVKCLKFATKAHKLLGCNSLARTDFIFDTKKNKIFFLETNTQPGLTPLSLLPEQANYKGVLFSEIIFILIKNLNY